LQRHTRHPPHQSQSHSISSLHIPKVVMGTRSLLIVRGDCISVIKTELIYAENSIGYIRVLVILREAQHKSLEIHKKKHSW
jgi:hypothetical protein